MKLQILVMWVLAASATIAAAVLEGQWTNRWGTSDALPRAAKVFAELPAEFGPWRLIESQPLAVSARGILQCQRDLQGLYENRQSAEQVIFTLLLGPPGPMSVHTPEICYGSVDQVPLGRRERVTLMSKGIENTAWRVDFHDAHDPQGTITRIYYAWSEGPQWSAVEEPRITFGGRPYLFKLQLLVRLPEELARKGNDPGREFLEEFLPEFAHAAAFLSGSKT